MLTRIQFYVLTVVLHILLFTSAAQCKERRTKNVTIFFDQPFRRSTDGSYSIEDFGTARFEDGKVYIRSDSGYSIVYNTQKGRVSMRFNGKVLRKIRPLKRRRDDAGVRLLVQSPASRLTANTSNAAGQVQLSCTSRNDHPIEANEHGFSGKDWQLEFKTAIFQSNRGNERSRFDILSQTLLGNDTYWSASLNSSSPRWEADGQSVTISMPPEMLREFSEIKRSFRYEVNDERFVDVNYAESDGWAGYFPSHSPNQPIFVEWPLDEPGRKLSLNCDNDVEAVTGERDGDVTIQGNMPIDTNTPIYLPYAYEWSDGGRRVVFTFGETWVVVGKLTDTEIQLKGQPLQQC